MVVFRDGVQFFHAGRFDWWRILVERPRNVESELLGVLILIVVVVDAYSFGLSPRFPLMI